MKKTIIALFLVLLIVGLCVSCDASVDKKLLGEQNGNGQNGNGETVTFSGTMSAVPSTFVLAINSSGEGTVTITPGSGEEQITGVSVVTDALTLSGGGTCTTLAVFTDINPMGYPILKNDGSPISTLAELLEQPTVKAYDGLDYIDLTK